MRGLRILMGASVLGLAACSDPTLEEEVPATLSAPFVGSWQVARPDGPGVIVNEPIASCDAPVVVTVQDEDTIAYASPGSSVSYFDLMAFEGRTTWIPMNADGTEVNGPYTFIAQAVSDDEFLFYNVTMGKADWDDPRAYTRCP